MQSPMNADCDQAMKTAMKANRKIKTAPAAGIMMGMCFTTASTGSAGSWESWFAVIIKTQNFIQFTIIAKSFRGQADDLFGGASLNTPQATTGPKRSLVTSSQVKEKSAKQSFQITS